MSRENIIRADTPPLREHTYITPTAPLPAPLPEDPWGENNNYHNIDGINVRATFDATITFDGHPEIPQGYLYSEEDYDLLDNVDDKKQEFFDYITNRYVGYIPMPEENDVPKESVYVDPDTHQVYTQFEPGTSEKTINSYLEQFSPVHNTPPTILVWLGEWRRSLRLTFATIALLLFSRFVLYNGIGWEPTISRQFLFIAFIVESLWFASTWIQTRREIAQHHVAINAYMKEAKNNHEQYL